MTEHDTYRNLMCQLDKLSRHNRQGSYLTRGRYYEAMARFCRFLADEYHLEKLSNVAPKHLNAYIAKLQSEGKAASTIKTDLAAIRFFHDQMDARYSLPDNAHLDVKLERRTFGGVDRTWSRREFERFLLAARQAGHEDYAAVATLTYYDGLRIHEAFRLDTATAEAALCTGHLTVKGKGGMVRTVPISKASRVALQSVLASTPRGHKLFVPDNLETHDAIKDMQRYIRTVRPEVRDPGSDRPMTHHGLRHSYAARTYQELVESGVAPQDASYKVSSLLGHKRPDVTAIYLAFVRDKGKPENSSDGALP